MNMTDTFFYFLMLLNFTAENSVIHDLNFHTNAKYKSSNEKRYG